MLHYLLFDLDETLYPPNTGMFCEVGRRIHSYMARMGIPWENVRQLRRDYYQRYGTTLRGLQLHHQVDVDDYLRFVHDFDVTHYIRPNPDLDQVLHTLVQEKVIFTSATTEYVQRVLQALGIAHHFRRIFDIRAVQFNCKPNELAYRIVLEALPASGPHCLLIEDNVRNLRAGKAVGMHTLLVGEGPGPSNHVDFVVAEVIGVGDVVRTIEDS